MSARPNGKKAERARGNDTLPYPAVSGAEKEGKVELNFGELADKCRRAAAHAAQLRRMRGGKSKNRGEKEGRVGKHR